MVTRRVSEDEPDTSSLTRRVSIDHRFQVIASCTTEKVTTSSGFHWSAALANLFVRESKDRKHEMAERDQAV